MDGDRGAHPRGALGEAAVGPLGLLTILETQLGLLAPAASRAERIVAYRRCLAAHREPARFYARSFAVDALGTAATLLDWRDQWYLAGWNGAAFSPGSPRLDDLAAVERDAAGGVPAGVGQRLEAVLVRLARRRLAIEAIVLVDPLEAFPARWRAVLDRLPCRAPETPAAHGRGFLHDLQTALIASRAQPAPAKVPWRADGTVRIVQAETRLIAAHWLAARLREPPHDTLLIASEAGGVLDGVLSTSGLAAQGLVEASPQRPALQLLTIALRTLWEPLDLPALLQLLTTPIGPLSSRVRRRLAETLAERPGLGGPHWQAALAELAARIGARWPEERAAIATWVEPERFARRDGAPIAALAARARQVGEFLQARLGEADPTLREAYRAGLAQAATAVRAFEELAAQGTERLKPAEVDAVVAQVTAAGHTDPAQVAEAGACVSVAAPGAVVDAFDRVLWWSPSLPSLPLPDPWSRSERAVLAAAGVHLPSMAERLTSEAAGWVKPVLAARAELTFVLSPPNAEAHPLWLWLDSLVDGWPIVRLESVLGTAGADEALAPVAVRRLPEPRRWWTLPNPARIVAPERSSYSSLERLLTHPARWLLGDVARLHRSRILALPDDFRLRGNLAHALVQRLYHDPNALALTAEAVLARLDADLDRLIAEEGALLLLPGRRGDRERFRASLRSALPRLHRHLQDAHVRSADPELPLAGEFAGGALHGYADLVVRRADGATGLVDLKWSGRQKYRDKLERNEQLQLAVYAELLRQRDRAWPAVAYFVFDAGLLYAQDARFFPDADVVDRRGTEDTANLWERFLAAWHWRHAQIVRGAIEVPVDGTEPTGDSEPPTDGLASLEVDERYDDFRHLYGWSAGA